MVPCDAISIPRISLYPWKKGYHHVHTAPVYHSAPVHAASVHIAPVHSAPVFTVSPAPALAPHPAAYSPQPPAYAPQPAAYSPQPPVYFPKPTDYSPFPDTQYSSGADTPIKPFVHDNFNTVAGRK